MLFPNYINDGSVSPFVTLDTKQKSEIEIVKKKMESGEYKFTKLDNCPCCNANEFETVAERDRYGFHNTNILCKQCGLMFSNPMWSDESVSDFYSNHYTNIYRSSSAPDIPSIHSRPYRIYSYIKNNVPLKDSSKILEIGCHYGQNLFFFNKDQHQVKGIDFDSDSLEIGRKCFNMDLSYGSIFFLEEKFDVIIMSHLLEHVVDLEGFLTKCSQLMSSNSYLYIEIPGLLKKYYNPEYPNLPYVFTDDIQNAHVYYFSLSTLTNIMNKYGYKLVKGNEIVESLWKYTGIKINDFQNDYENIRITLTQIAPLQKEIMAMRNEIQTLKDSLHSLQNTNILLQKLKNTLAYRALRKLYRIIFKK